MAASIQERDGKFQLRVTHPLLPKPFFCTYDERTEAETVRDKLRAHLAAGRVPADLLVQDRAASPLLVQVVRQYLQLAPVTASDEELLSYMVGELMAHKLRVRDVGLAWADQYVHELKVKANLSPGTIRKRVGALARVLDWYLAREAEAATKAGQQERQDFFNPLRQLPKGYSGYTQLESRMVEGRGLQAKTDVERDRRLAPNEEARVRQALAGEKRGDRERPLAADEEFRLLFDLILDTGLRLSEAYKLRIFMDDLRRGVLRVDGSKGARGKKKPRQVPLRKPMQERLMAWCEGRVGLVFSYWDGNAESARNVTNRLSHRFGSLFTYAMVDDFTEHDLRHEATCRWFEMRRPDGGWVFSDVEVCRIMGWKKMDMALRYASLRGEDLSSRMA